MSDTKKTGALPKAGQKTVVAGAGRSGVAAARVLRGLNAQVKLVDKNSDALPEQTLRELRSEGIEVKLGTQDAADYQDADFIVASPGFPISKLHEMFVGKDRTPEIMSELELAWRSLDGEPVLAITGTSGKTTTTSLAAAMLEEQGLKVFLGGNIGTPLCEYILSKDKADVLVLEVSSFQLQGCGTFHPHVAVLLNITPNHLDYHKDMREYVDAKMQIFRCQDKNDYAIVGKAAAGFLEGRDFRARLSWIEDNPTPFKSHLLGAHNKINIEAAWKASRHFGASLENAGKAVAKFKPLEHRLEFVGELDGASFINDSKCTTVSSLEVALKSFDKPLRLLCGGKFKGGDLAALRDLVREKVKEVALFGANRDKFESAWEGLVPIHWHNTLEEAMDRLNKTKEPGDIVLLSPATSSFDQYENYEARGDDFKRIFKKLKES